MDDNGYEYSRISRGGYSYDFFERINYYVKTNQLKEKKRRGMALAARIASPQVWHSIPAPTGPPRGNGAPRPLI